jgi:pre-60S factor REI1
MLQAMDPAQHTCLTCSVMFQDAELQRNHYKTDWHRYNLKRKVAEMPPVTLESFEQRMVKHEAQMKVLSGEVKEPTGYCVACRKSFGSKKAYENHLNSKKHKEFQEQFEKKEDKVRWRQAVNVSSGSSFFH